MSHPGPYCPRRMAAPPSPMGRNSSGQQHQTHPDVSWPPPQVHRENSGQEWPAPVAGIPHFGYPTGTTIWGRNQETLIWLHLPMSHPGSLILFRGSPPPFWGRHFFVAHPRHQPEIRTGGPQVATDGNVRGESLPPRALLVRARALGRVAVPSDHPPRTVSPAGG